jgi:hypothetical protein
MKWKLYARRLSLSNMKYHPSICVEGPEKQQNISHTSAGVPDEITTKHILNECQKYYRFSQPSQSLSVRWKSLLIICIHKILIWMACCSGICRKYAYQLLMELGKCCQRRSSFNASHVDACGPTTVSHMSNTWSSVNTGALSLQHFTPLHTGECCKLQNTSGNSKLNKHTSALKHNLVFQLSL